MKNCTSNCEAGQDSGIISNPLSFARSGSYSWDKSTLGWRGYGGTYWSLISTNATYSNNLNFGDGYISPLYSYARGHGFAVRYLGLAPDSICPKGWQLPTYSGDKSFTTLINTSYSMKNNGQTTEDNRDSGVLSNPLSFVRSGYFVWGSAGLGDRGGNGNYWSLRSYSTANSNYLYFANTSLNPQLSYSRGGGFAVRCVSVYGINSLF